jgi:orotate phosphoribosyltransferase
MTLRRGFEVRAGQSLIIVEDVITTGKTSAETALVLEAMGARVSAFACVVDRRGGQLRSGQPSGSAPLDGRPVFASVRLSADVWDAADCPLCGRLPLVKPGSRPISNEQ